MKNVLEISNNKERVTREELQSMLKNGVMIEGQWFSVIEYKPHQLSAYAGTENDNVALITPQGGLYSTLRLETKKERKKRIEKKERRKIERVRGFGLSQKLNLAKFR